MGRVKTFPIIVILLCGFLLLLTLGTATSFTASAAETSEEDPHIHSWDAGSVTSSATCTSSGRRTYQCSTCGATRTETIAPLGHNYRGSTQREPTCTNAGMVSYKCERCSTSYTESTPAAGHFYEESGIEATDNFCIDTKYTCSVCGEYYYKLSGTQELTEHDWDAGEMSVLFRNNETGETFYSVKYKCTVESCSAVKTETFSSVKNSEDLNDARTQIAIKEFAEEFRTLIFDQYIKNGYMMLLFASLTVLWGIPCGVSFIVARRQDDREKARKMVKNLLLGIIGVFFIFVAAPLLLTGIASIIV